MAAPAVRDLQKLIAQQNKALQPLYGLIDADIAANDALGKAQEAGLAATAEREYGKIEQRAEDKGMFFSGFSPAEQAEYNATTYLPELARMQAAIAAGRSGLMREKAGLGKQAFDTAVDLQESDRDRRFTYTERVAGQKFTAAENARDRAASAAQAREAASTGDIKGTVSAVGKYLKKRVGSDGKVSPQTFQEGRQIWIAAGGDPAAYAQSFYGYVNRSHEDDYF